MTGCVCEMGKGVPAELLTVITKRGTARPNNVAGFWAVCPVGVGFELWPRGLNCGVWTRRTGEKPPTLTRPARGRRYKDGRPIARAYRRGCRPKPRTSHTPRGRLSKCRQCGLVGTRSRGRRVGGCVGACSIVGDAPIKGFRLKVQHSHDSQSSQSSQSMDHLCSSKACISSNMAWISSSVMLSQSGSLAGVCALIPRRRHGGI